MEIIEKNRNLVVVYKPAGMPSQPDQSGDKDAFSLCKEKLARSSEPGELYLIHRLDRVVSGLLVFARNKKCAAELSALVSGDGIGKEYLAVIDGYTEGGRWVDLLYKDSRAGKSFVVDRKRAGVKEAVLDFIPLQTVESERGIKTLVKIKLLTGRFHQIRAQFGSRKLPISGDGKYGSRDNKPIFPALFAYKLSAELSCFRLYAMRLPDISEYPWNLFDEKNYGEL